MPAPLDQASGIQGRNPQLDPLHPANAEPVQPFPQQPQAPVGPEQELWVGRTQWRHYAVRVLLWFLLNGLAGYGTWYLTQRLAELTRIHAAWIMVGIVAITSLIILGPLAITIWGRRYRLTSQRLFTERGIFSKVIDQMELTRVEDLQIEKKFIDRLFGLGTIALLTTDVSDRKVLIEGVHEPDKVAEIVRTRMRNLRGRSVFVENLTP